MFQKVREMTIPVGETIAEVRVITSDLRPGLFDHFGPPAAIGWRFEEYTDRTVVVSKLTLGQADLGRHGDPTPCASAWCSRP